MINILKNATWSMALELIVVGFIVYTLCMHVPYRREKGNFVKKGKDGKKLDTLNFVY